MSFVAVLIIGVAALVSGVIGLGLYSVMGIEGTVCAVVLALFIGAVAGHLAADYDENRI